MDNVPVAAPVNKELFLLALIARVWLACIPSCLLEGAF